MKKGEVEVAQGIFDMGTDVACRLGIKLSLDVLEERLVELKDLKPASWERLEIVRALIEENILITKRLKETLGGV